MEEVTLHFNQRVTMDGNNGVCLSFVRSDSGYLWYLIVWDDGSHSWHYARELTTL